MSNCLSKNENLLNPTSAIKQLIDNPALKVNESFEKKTQVDIN